MINKRKVTIKPVPYSGMLEVVFLILPYLKMVRVIKDEHKSFMEPDIFFDVIENLILQLKPKDLSRVLQIFLDQDEEFVSVLTNKDLVMLAPIIIRENNIVETMLLLRSLGAFH